MNKDITLKAMELAAQIRAEAASYEDILLLIEEVLADYALNPDSEVKTPEYYKYNSGAQIGCFTNDEMFL